jgi:hypothetical protein
LVGLLLSGGEIWVATAINVKERQLKVAAKSTHDLDGFRNMMVILSSRNDRGSDIAATVVIDADCRWPTASKVSPYCFASPPLLSTPASQSTSMA